MRVKVEPKSKNISKRNYILNISKLQIISRSKNKTKNKTSNKNFKLAQQQKINRIKIYALFSLYLCSKHKTR